MAYDDFVTTTQTSPWTATIATEADKQQIWQYYGTGPFWIQAGALYQDVFFNLTSCNPYVVDDFLLQGRQQAGDRSIWRPLGYGVNGDTACHAEIYNWERVLPDICVCQTYEVATYTRTCNGASYDETLTTSTTNTSDISTCTIPSYCSSDLTQCTVDQGLPYCTSGQKQPGLNDCDINKEEYSGTITCNGAPYPKTRTATTCLTTVNVDLQLEKRTIPNFLRGIVKWDSLKCTPCMKGPTAAVNVDTPETPESPIDQSKKLCTDFRVFQGHDRRCALSGVTNLFTNCCNLSGWFTSWCSNEERELKKRRQAKICHKVGDYCAEKIDFLGICLKKKRTYCCYDSELARVVIEQGKPQLNENFGSGNSPNCKGLTPKELSELDFSKMNLSEIETTMKNKAAAGQGQATSNALKGIQNWYIGPQGTGPQNKQYPGATQ